MPPFRAFGIRNGGFSFHEQIFHELNGGWADEHHEDSGEDEQHQRKDHFHGGLLGFFLCELTAFDTHRLGLDSQSSGD